MDREHRPARPRGVTSLAQETFDVLVLGGGISGASVALLAARAGLRVALCERADFGAGTSGRSSRLLHGGFRYLAHGRLGLVRQSLRAQTEWTTLAPHLVRRMPFLLPFWSEARHSPWLLRAAGALYGRLSPSGPAGVSCLGAEALAELEPCVRGARPAGALSFDEYDVADARLAVEVALAAARAGAVVCNRVAFESLRRERGRVAGALLRDVLTGARFTVSARAVVSAMGPWTDRVMEGPSRLRLSRGTHVLIPGARLPLQHAVAFFAPQDGRPLFARPAGLRGWPATLIGTTEVEHQGAPDNVQPGRDEIRYLMHAAAVAFPAWKLRPDDVAHAYAGVRPLERTARSAGRSDRRYVARWEEPGLLTLWGGKLTLALEGARLALRRLRAERRSLALPEVEVPAWGTLAPLDETRAAPWASAAVSARLRLLGIAERSVAHLLSTYGARTGELLWLIEGDRALSAPILRGAPHLLAEAAYAARAEMACSADDFLHRRTQLGLWLACAEGPHAPVPSSLCALWPGPALPFEETVSASRHDTRP